MMTFVCGSKIQNLVVNFHGLCLCEWHFFVCFLFEEGYFRNETDPGSLRKLRNRQQLAQLSATVVNVSSNDKPDLDKWAYVPRHAIING